MMSLFLELNNYVLYQILGQKEIISIMLANQLCLIQLHKDDNR